MAFVYHASDTDSDCGEGLESGNVALARSFGQMSPQQHVSSAQQQPRSAASQQPAELDISSLPDWDPATVTPVALHGNGGAPAGGSALQAAAGGRQGLGGAGSGASTGQTFYAQSGGVPHGRGAAARLLQQSEYMRKNSTTPPPLPAPPEWLRNRLGGESLTERYLRNGRPQLASARAKPAPPPVLLRQLHLQQQLDLQRPSVLNGILQHPDAAPPLPAAALQPAAPAGGSTGAGAHLRVSGAQPHADWQHSNGSNGSGGASAARPPPSPLHQELLRFAAQAVPSQQEAAAVQQGLAGIRAAAQLVWPDSTATLFGSQATGLALPGADLDVVVLGAHSELQNPAQGYSHEARNAISDLLEDLLDALRAAEPPVLLPSKRAQIIKAKVPIIKCTLAAGGGGGIPADISLGTANGVGAAHYINRQLSVLPMLRPLILAVKAYLREKGLNEVFCGGLSSYTVASMCMAHLQAEGLAMLAPAAVSTAVGSGQPVVDLQATAAAAAAAGTVVDVGYLLHSFFTRFGSFFKYESEAVSVRRGGITAKLPQWRLNKRKWLLAVEDPQEKDKDIAQGSYSIRQVKTAFKAAAAKLQAAVSPAAARKAAVAQAEAAAWAQIQADGQSRSAAAGPAFPILQSLFDAELVLSRDADAAAKRAAAAAAASRKARLDGLKIGTKARRKMGLAPDGTPLPPKAPRGGKFRVQTQHKRSEVNGHGGQYNGGRLPITKGATKAGAKGRKGQGKQPGSQKPPRRKKKKQQQQPGKMLGQRSGGVHKK